LPIGISGIAVMVTNFGDRFFLQRNVTVAEIGLYSIAYKIGMLIGHLQAIFCTYWMSQMFLVMKQPDADRIFGRVTTYYALVLSTGAMFLCVFAYPLLRVLAAPSYIVAARYIPLVAIAYLIKAMGDHVRSLVFVEKRPVIDMRITYTGSAVCLAGYIWLIPRYKLYGALAATLIAFVVMAVHSFWEVRRLRPVVLEWKRLRIIAGGLVLSIAIASSVQQENLLVRFGVGIASSIVFIAVLTRGKIFHQHELDSLLDLVKPLGRLKARIVG
jgi:O-antigen/teichoic acid export membrane protein